MESEYEVRKMISEKLKMVHSKIEVECAHLTGKFTTGDRPRPSS